MIKSICENRIFNRKDEENYIIYILKLYMR